MLYTRRTDWACGYYCCRELHKNKGNNWHRLLRTREKRTWQAEAIAHKALLCDDCDNLIVPGDRYATAPHGGHLCLSCN